jgi:hypothetical protein
LGFAAAAQAGAPAPSVFDRSTASVPHDGTVFGSVFVDDTDAARGERSLRRPSGGTEADRLSIGGPLADFDNTTGYAFMAWVKLPSAPMTDQGIVNIGACCAARDGYTLQVLSGGTVRFWGGASDDETNYNIYSTVNVGDGEWHHVGARADGTDIELLIDGVSDGTTGTNLPTSPSLAMGDGGGDFFPSVAGEGVDDGDFGSEILIDEVRVYGSYLDDGAWARALAGIGLPDKLYYDFELAGAAAVNGLRCFKAGTPKGEPKFAGASGELANALETKQTDIGKPRSVCVPTSRDGSVIPDPDVNLVCYQAKDTKTSPKQTKFQKLTQILSNPLGAAQSLELKKPDVYCEPSTLDIM